MPKPSTKRCIFCRKPRDSVEDALPKWLDRYWRLVVNVQGRGVLTLDEAKAHGIKMHLVRTGNVRGQAIPDRKFEKLRLALLNCCQRCNNGWMSHMEKRVAPLIVPMMQARGAVEMRSGYRRVPATELSPDDQELIASWALKFAMVTEWAFVDRVPYFTDVERWRFRQIQRPGVTQVYVWLAYVADLHQGDRLRLWHAHAQDLLFLSEFVGERSVHGHVVTFSIFHLAFQLLAVRRGERTGDKRPFPEFFDMPYERTVIPIWPIRGVQSWPPPEHLTHDMFEAFTKRWTTAGDAWNEMQLMPPGRHLYRRPSER